MVELAVKVVCVMMKLQTSRTIWLVLSGLFVLCLGSVSCGPSNDGSESMELEKFYKKITELTYEGACTHGYECPRKQLTSEVTFVSLFGDKNTCKEKIEETLTTTTDDELSDLKDDIDKGLSKYDGEKAKECFDKLKKQIENNPCGNPETDAFNRSVCRDVLQGTQPRGEPCTNDEHCKTGFCDPSAGDPTACYSACGAPATKASGGRDCGPGSPKYCDPKGGLVCESSGTGSAGTCKKERSVPAGNSCASSVVCEGNLTCVEGTCQELTLKSDGASCDPDEPAIVCKPGLTCQIESIDRTTGTVNTVCGPPKSAGGDCYSGNACKFDYYCKGTEPLAGMAGTCAKPKANGEACESGEECKSGNCKNSTCAPPDTGDDCDVPKSGGNGSGNGTDAGSSSSSSGTDSGL